jgi:hypothetical protein
MKIFLGKRVPNQASVPITGTLGDYVVNSQLQHLHRVIFRNRIKLVGEATFETQRYSTLDKLFTRDIIGKRNAWKMSKRVIISTMGEKRQGVRFSKRVQRWINHFL